MTDRDEVTFYDISPKYQERLLAWLATDGGRVKITGSTEGFTVSGGGNSVTDASLEAALNKIIGFRGRRGALDPDFEERVLVWLTAKHAMMTIARGTSDVFIVELRSDTRVARATDEDFEIALVIAEDDFSEGASGPDVDVEAPTVAVRDIEPETLAAPTRLFGGEEEPETLAAPTRFFGGADDRTLVSNRHGSYAAWVPEVSDQLETIGAHFDDAAPAYWRQLYQAGFSPAEAVAEFGVQHRESLGIRRNGAPPAPSTRSGRRGHTSALHVARRMIAEDTAERRRRERPFDPEAPREHYARSHHFAVNPHMPLDWRQGAEWAEAAAPRSKYSVLRSYDGPGFTATVEQGGVPMATLGTFPTVEQARAACDLHYLRQFPA